MPNQGDAWDDVIIFTPEQLRYAYGHHPTEPPHRTAPSPSREFVNKRDLIIPIAEPGECYLCDEGHPLCRYHPQNLACLEGPACENPHHTIQTWAGEFDGDEYQEHLHLTRWLNRPGEDEEEPVMPATPVSGRSAARIRGRWATQTPTPHDKPDTAQKPDHPTRYEKP